MKAFITGATGFVGTHLAECLLRHGDRVAGASRHGTWLAETPPNLSSNVALVAWDMASGLSARVGDHVAEFAPDVIYHLAAISVPGDCGADEPSRAAIAANVDGTRSVIDLATSLPHRPRVVFSSSCYVYGIVTASDPVVSEDTPCRPISGYGITKLAAEGELLRAARERALDVVIARAFQHTGPRQSPRMIVPDWTRQLMAESDEPIRAICLDTFLDLSDVRDVVRAYRLLAESGHSQSIYNVGSGVCRRSGALLDLLLRIAGTNRQVVELSPGQRQHPIADVEWLNSQTGWRAEIPIEQTLADVLDFWRHLPPAAHGRE